MTKFISTGIKPIKDDWKPTGIKGERYALYKNSDGLITPYFDGKRLPYQTDLTWNQEMGDVVSVTVTVLFG